MKLKSLHYIWSIKPKWGSKMISWASNKYTPMKDCPSHVALLINEKWVFESTYKYDVNITSYKKWKKENIETQKLLCSQERHYDEIKSTMRSIKGKKYDWGGIVYFIWRFILFWIFKTPPTKKNKLENPNKYFCCEAVGKITNTDYSMTTPADIYIKLKKELENA